MVDAEPSGGHPISAGDLAVLSTGECVPCDVAVWGVVGEIDLARDSADRNTRAPLPSPSPHRDQGVGQLLLNMSTRHSTFNKAQRRFLDLTDFQGETFDLSGHLDDQLACVIRSVGAGCKYYTPRKAAIRFPRGVSLRVGLVDRLVYGRKRRSWPVNSITVRRVRGGCIEGTKR